MKDIQDHLRNLSAFNIWDSPNPSPPEVPKHPVIPKEGTFGPTRFAYGPLRFAYGPGPQIVTHTPIPITYGYPVTAQSSSTSIIKFGPNTDINDLTDEQFEALKKRVLG